MSGAGTDAQLIGYLRERGFLPETASAGVKLTALSGGVSAETVLVEAGTERLVLKRALERLLVAGDWHAKPERAMTEAAAMQALHAITPGNVPRLLDADRQLNVVVM